MYEQSQGPAFPFLHFPPCSLVFQSCIFLVHQFQCSNSSIIQYWPAQCYLAEHTTHFRTLWLFQPFYCKEWFIFIWHWRQIRLLKYVSIWLILTCCNILEFFCVLLEITIYRHWFDWITTVIQLYDGNSIRPPARYIGSITGPSATVPHPCLASLISVSSIWATPVFIKEQLAPYLQEIAIVGLRLRRNIQI